MDKFRNWFKKKELKPELEQAMEAVEEAVEAEHEAEDAAQKAVEEPPPAVEESAAEAVEEASTAVKGKNIFQKAWDKTVQIALTPVDPFFIKMAQGLDKTRKNLVGGMVGLFRLHKKIDEEFWEELHDILICADLGPVTSERIIESLRAVVKQKKLSEPSELVGELKGVLGQILQTNAEEPGIPAASRELNVKKGRLNVVLMVGVNGTGKTTTTAKLANLFKQQGLKVMLVAADTFRAAAIEQLQVWGERLDLEVIRHKEGSDPSAVVFDAVSAARARGADLLLVDTAGRLHSKANLMEELKKMRRILQREIEDAPHEVLLVLDATTGQNALIQAREFMQAVDVTGLALCKLDGTARGGIVVSIAQEFQLPVKLIGVGEGIEDLQPFVPEVFLEALFSEAGTESEPPVAQEV
ncbi:MAG: signal recognition particle receptor FtsY [Candidatus Xenobia bacterium]|jgi:fused signal recognition particle receptor